MRRINWMIQPLTQKMMALGLAMAVLTPAALAHETTYRRVYDTRTHQYVYVPEKSTTSKVKQKARQAWHNPVVKKAAIGAGIGAAAGMLSDRTSVLKGAGIGALAGAGTGLIDRSRTLESKPLARTALKGAVIGTGVGAVAGKSALKGGLIGAGAGAGLHYVRKYMDREPDYYHDDY